MAIYHLEAKVVSRGTGRSAVAASAYLSCTNILNDYDGVRHDYTRKKGLIWREVFLPEYAPPEWKDRGVLWNAVEENEKTKDSRLAREFVPALPVELTPTQWQELLSDFIKESFVADGMCADVAIHDPYPPGHNPHAHILLTVRPLDERGEWQYKTEKEYLCVKDGEERGFTAAEFKAAQADGWEKQYPYKVGRKKVYMPPSEAEKQGLERASKHPKSTKFGRQNPISERWNSEEQLVVWRKAWADVTNRYLERYGHDARIDHRSHAERGLVEQPTIHEGVVARAMEKKGIISDRCELNRQIKADNALLRELKAAVKKLAQEVLHSRPELAKSMEFLRQKLLIFCYQLNHIRTGKSVIGKSVDAWNINLNRYSEVVDQIKETKRERTDLLAEKKELPFWNIPRKNELTARIAELTELLEELQSEKAILLDNMDCTEGKDVSKVRKKVALMEANLKELDEQEQKYSAELETALAEYAELKTQGEQFDPVELHDTRQELRPEMEQTAVQRVKEKYGDKYSHRTMDDSKRDVSRHLDEYAESQEIRQIQREREYQQRRQNKAKQERKLITNQQIPETANALVPVIGYEPWSLRALESIKSSIVNGVPTLIRVHSAADYPIENEELSHRLDMESHCVLIVGYNDDKEEFDIVDPWNPNWGGQHGGVGKLPYESLHVACVNCTAEKGTRLSLISHKIRPVLIEENASLAVDLGFYEPLGYVIDELPNRKQD